MVGLAWWSQTAASNATQDTTVNWQEGQTPSSVNDSGRAMMASAAKWRDDVAGAITTGGTSTAYTVTSYQVFDTLARMSNQVIAFTPHTTNGATVTLNVDGLGAKPLRSAPSIELPAGTLIQGTPYVALYSNTDGAFYLQALFGQPYSVPVGGLIDFVGSTAPNSSFVFPYGQGISRTTYSTLFALVGTTYGNGDGSTTFNVPDLRGRVVAGKDDMGGSAASRLTATYFGTSAASLGAVGGSENHTLTTGEMPVHNHGITDTGHAHGLNNIKFSQTNVTGGINANDYLPTGNTASGQTTDTATTGISINNAGSGNAHAIVQPTIVCNKLLRII